MEFTLGDDDRRAIDLLLDHSPEHFEDGDAAHAHPSGFAAVVDADFDDRIGQVESILKLLSEMPEPEVPPHLVSNTLSFIDTTNPRSPRISPRDRSPLEDRPSA